MKVIRKKGESFEELFKRFKKIIIESKILLRNKKKIKRKKMRKLDSNQ
ncbi:hypothetical protein ACWNX6_00495 [Candidatus Vidania fulgoroideorum]